MAVIAVSRVTAAHEYATVVSSRHPINSKETAHPDEHKPKCVEQEFNEGIPIVVCSQGVGMCGMLWGWVMLMHASI